MKEITLTQDQVAIVDDEDFMYLSQHKWSASKINGIFYAIRGVVIQSQDKAKNIKCKQKNTYMHRVIKEAQLARKLTTDEHIDHINGNGLDNCRCNLRICTVKENSWNRKKSKGTTSIYKGVSWYKNHKKWGVDIRVDNVGKHLGFFDDEMDAAKAYDKAAVKYFGEFARRNFE